MADDAEPIRFGRASVYRRQRLLTCGSRRHRLRPTVLRVLLYFLQHREQTLSKDRLLDELWNNTANESTLSSYVSQIRPLIKDSSWQIETIAKVGYCFRESEVEAGSNELAAEPPLLSANQYLGVDRIGFFQDFTGTFEELFKTSRRIITLFIHSRRWRENHDPKIRAFLARRGTRLDVYLPDPLDATLKAGFLKNFEDGVHIPDFIDDACQYFLRLWRRHPKRVVVRFHSYYPTYSFYVFDKTVIFAMYPTTAHRAMVPTLQTQSTTQAGQFVFEDLAKLKKESRRPTQREIRQFLKRAPRRHH